MVKDLIKEEVKKEVKPEVKEAWSVGQVATQTQAVLVNTETNQQFEVVDALALILNKLDELKRTFG